MNKNSVFSALLALAAIMMIVRFIPASVDENLTLLLSKNGDTITRIDTPRQIEATRTVMIDKVQLNENNRFKHPVLGVLGWNEDFFADITTRFKVTQPGRYRFVVGSDDGFSLHIDDKLLCQHLSDRPFRKQSCYRRLSEGEHTLKLSYFQGYGNAGLSLEAAAQGEGKPRYWGETIKGIEYLP